MRNYELFSPVCPDDHAKKLVLNYALRGLLDDRRCYTDEKLLAMQSRVYKEWLEEVRETSTGFYCCFHEWMMRDCDHAFIFRPGDLVKYKGRYCVVADRIACETMDWGHKWRITGDSITGDSPVVSAWPHPLTSLFVKDTDGKVLRISGLDIGLEPADIPPEVFALACGRAKDCPMLKGGRDGE